MIAYTRIYTIIPAGDGLPHSMIQYTSTDSEHTEIELELARRTWMKRSKCDVRHDTSQCFIAEIRGGDVVMLMIDQQSINLRIEI